ncbi:hypothetical protein ETB97_005659 [Aspergillus alliaceus]|uniref:Uncharacterized protein n=1 Tax=Petromyces alliaceus TaxID=209559 RepID=A0A8H5ZYT0_PETAA|nr:hypothetical protein ETB97_005659 [Aspergillus burnettii]
MGVAFVKPRQADGRVLYLSSLAAGTKPASTSPGTRRTRGAPPEPQPDTIEVKSERSDSDEDQHELNKAAVAELDSMQRKKKKQHLAPDTAHKNATDKNHQAAALVKADLNLFLSAASMFNKAIELCGYLAILHHNLDYRAAESNDGSKANNNTDKDDEEDGDTWGQA